MRNKKLKNILLTSAAVMTVSLTPTHTLHSAEGGVAVMAYEDVKSMAIVSINAFMSDIAESCGSSFFTSACLERLTRFGVIALRPKWGLNVEIDAKVESILFIKATDAHLNLWLTRLGLCHNDSIALHANTINQELSALLYTSGEPNRRKWFDLTQNLTELLERLMDH